MDSYSQILDYINNNKTIWTEYTGNQLKQKETLKLLSEIMKNSNKTAAEATLVLLASIRFLSNTPEMLLILEKEDTFLDYITSNYTKILEISSNNKVQANIPERGLPISEILNQVNTTKNLIVIELGSSYGLIGKCLLNIDETINNKSKYFIKNQKIPTSYKKADFYLGIDLDIPSKKWILSCLPDPNNARRLDSFIKDSENTNNFTVIKGSAFDIEKILSNSKIDISKYTPIILTSFMMYQLNKEEKKALIKVINNFCKKNDGIWLNQMVEIASNGSDDSYYIEKNEVKIIKLSNDRCENWNKI